MNKNEHQILKLVFDSNRAESNLRINSINFFDLYRICLRRTAAVKPDFRVLGIKFKDLSPLTPCSRHFEFYNSFKFVINSIFEKLKTVSILDPNILKMIFFNIIINLNKLNESLFFLL